MIFLLSIFNRSPFQLSVLHMTQLNPALVSQPLADIIAIYGLVVDILIARQRIKRLPTIQGSDPIGT